VGVSGSSVSRVPRMEGEGEGRGGRGDGDRSVGEHTRPRTFKDALPGRPFSNAPRVNPVTVINEQ